MKSRILAACLMGVTLVVSPLAYSAPGNGAQVIRFKTYHDLVAAYSDDGAQFKSAIGQRYNDYQGVEHTSASAFLYDYILGSYSEIACDFAAADIVVSVNTGTGNSVLKATLD